MICISSIGDWQGAPNSVAVGRGSEEQLRRVQECEAEQWSVNTKNGVRVIELKYNSTFERGPAVESFTYQMSGDKPLLAHCNIKAPGDAKKSEGEKKEGP